MPHFSSTLATPTAAVLTRTIQFAFAVVVLGTSAKTIAAFSPFSYGSLLVSVSTISVAYIWYVLGATYVAPVLAPAGFVFLLEVAIQLLWFAAFISFANHWADVHRSKATGTASVCFLAFSWVLFLYTNVVLGLNLRGGFSVTSNAGRRLAKGGLDLQTEIGSLVGAENPSANHAGSQGSGPKEEALSTPPVLPETTPNATQV